MTRNVTRNCFGSTSICPLLFLSSQWCGAFCGVVCPLCMFVFLSFCVWLCFCPLCMFICLCVSVRMLLVLCLCTVREMSRGVGMKVYVYLDGWSQGKEVRVPWLTFWGFELAYHLERPSKSAVSFPYITICFLFKGGRVVNKSVNGIRMFFNLVLSWI